VAGVDLYVLCFWTAAAAAGFDHSSGCAAELVTLLQCPLQDASETGHSQLQSALTDNASLSDVLSIRGQKQYQPRCCY